VEWITDCIGYLSVHGYATAEATAEAEAAWMRHVTEVAYSTLFPQADSWYLGGNIPGKPGCSPPMWAVSGRTAINATSWPPPVMRGSHWECPYP